MVGLSFVIVLLAGLASSLAEPMLHLFGTVERFRNNHVYANIGDSLELICMPQKSLTPSEKQYLRWIDGRGNDFCSAPEAPQKCAWVVHQDRLSLSLSTKVYDPMKLTCKYTQQRHEGWNATVKVFTRSANEADRLALDFNETNPSPIELQCPLDVSVTPAQWYLNGKLLESSEHVHLFDNGTLYISKPTIRNTGVYMCHTSDKHYSFVEVRGKATILDKQHGSKNYMVDDNAEISCLVYGHPLPKVSWKRDGVEMTEFDSRVYPIAYDGVPNGSLVLKSLTYEDRAVYTCMVENEFGTDESDVLLRVKDKLAALWPFLGILAEVIILMTIIFVFEKRRLKKEREELQALPEQKMTLTAPNSDKDVRQRKT